MPSLMSQLKPIRPEAVSEFMPPEDEEPPFQRVLRAGEKVMAARMRIRRLVWIAMGMPVGFAVAWLPWVAWVTVAVVAVAWLVYAIVAYNSAKVAQMEVQQDAERGIKIVEPREEESPPKKESPPKNEEPKKENAA